MYSVINNTAYITGNNGIYDNYIQNPNVKYGRNAASNLMDYFKQSAPTNTNTRLDNLPPVDFQYYYSPNCPQGISIDSLMGAAYEEMGKKTEISVKELDDKYIAAGETNLSAAAGDINNDGKIDLGEYAASILATDGMDGYLNGSISSRDLDNTVIYAQKQNYNTTNNIYKAYYYNFNLNYAKNAFLSNPNNLI